MILRSHVVPTLPLRNSNVAPTECVYMGAEESEYRKIFLQHLREFHKMRVSIPFASLAFSPSLHSIYLMSGRCGSRKQTMRLRIAKTGWNYNRRHGCRQN